MNDVIEFSKKCIPAPEYVVLRVINRNDKFEVDGIIVPTKTYSNERLGFYQIVEVGSVAAKEYGLKKGDYVVADRLAQCYKTQPIAVMKYTNVIALTDERNETFSPLRNMVFVKDDPHTTTDVGGILVSGYSKQLNIGKVVAMNVPDDVEVPFKVGDDVMLVKGGDSVRIGTEHVMIYHYDRIACKVEENENE